MSDDWKIKCCPKCGDIEMLGLEEDCSYCGYKLQDTEYYFTESVERGNLKPEIRKAIFEKYIKNSPLYSQEAVKDREEKENWERISLPSSYTPKNTPKCPTCGSTNIEKISTTKKAVGFVAVGIFSSNFGKTMRCKQCGYKW